MAVVAPVAAAAQIATFQASGNGYFVEMATRPQTIGYALLASPVALAAWMIDHDTDAYYKIARAFVEHAQLARVVHTAALEMHPLDTENRVDELKNEFGIGYCNITKCCTKVCPEHITITDNAIIPLKERVVDEFYDPLGGIWRWLRRVLNA